MLNSESDTINGFILKDKERLDDLVRGGLKIIQSPEAFCFSMDAVLLANFASVKKGDRIIDLGTGTGVLPLLLSTRAPVKTIIGLEIQQESAERAARSIAGNKLEQLIHIHKGNLCTAADQFGVGQFDLVVSNPPYMPVGRGEQNEESAIAIARHEIFCNLKDVINAGSRLVKFGGRFAMVHRPDRLTEIILELERHRLKPRKLQFVHPRASKKPNMILIEAQSGGNPELIVMEPFIVYDEEGNYTKTFWETYYPGLPYRGKPGEQL